MIIIKVNSFVSYFIKLFNILNSFYLFIWFFSTLFISPRCILKKCWLFFTLVRSSLPSRILLITSTPLSNSLNFKSEVSPLYLYIKWSLLTSLSKLAIFSNLSSTSLLNISFCFEIRVLSLTSKAYFLIVNFLLSF